MTIRKSGASYPAPTAFFRQETGTAQVQPGGCEAKASAIRDP